MSFIQLSQTGRLQEVKKEIAMHTVAGLNLKIGHQTRTLNPLKFLRCPLDKGDSLSNVDHCYNAWGTSYLPQFSHDSFRVKMVCDSKRGRSNKSGEIALSPTNKIIQGDWTWHPNRTKDNPKYLWHNVRGQFRNNILFGDGHVDFYKFPDKAPSWIWSPAPNPGWKWW